MKKPPVREELEINGLFAVQLKVEDERFLLAGPDGASLKKVDDGFILLDGEAYISRGAAYYESGQYMQAISDLTQAIELNPQYAKAYAYRGIAYAYRGNTEEAKNDLVKTVELSPDLKPMVKMASDNFKLDLKLD